MRTALALLLLLLTGWGYYCTYQSPDEWPAGHVLPVSPFNPTFVRVRTEAGIFYRHMPWWVASLPVGRHWTGYLERYPKPWWAWVLPAVPALAGVGLLVCSRGRTV